ncbi:SdpI family protein [Agrococcus sp. SL85]|uniref:SdpI family protein n=1 Tax=Agrococcus sp. SL85 TaxID=2995141 RepID=UPI00226D03F9|nr:SdpI family protein [Agrococcus sp. SL85]WAC66356.1 SdpI family protein [Agrococcus sp. SL85]
MDAQELAGAAWGLALASAAVVLGSVGAIVLVHLAGIGRLRRNPYAGIRTRTLLASDDAWRLGHRAATPITWLTGSVATLAGFGGFAAALAGSPATGAVLVVLAAISLLLGALLGAWRAHATVA